MKTRRFLALVVIGRTVSAITGRHAARGAFFKLVVLASFLLLWVHGAPATAQELFVHPMFEVSVATGIQYGTNVNGDGEEMALLLDLYQPTGEGLPDQCPAIVLMHGGFFVGGGRGDMGTYPTEFASRGYVTVSIDYRMLFDFPPAPGESLEQFPLRFPDWLPVRLADWGVTLEQYLDTIAAAVEDEATAVNWLVANAATYDIDPNMIAAGGFSAGAVSSLLLGVGGVDAVDADVGAVFSYAGGLFGWETAVDPNDPGVFMLHGTEDTTVPFAEVAFVQAALTGAGVPFESLIVEGGGHGGLEGPLFDNPDPFFEFMIGQLVPEPGTTTLLLVGCATLALVWRWRRR